MARKEDDYPLTRGLRMKAVREARKVEQDEFAVLMTRAAETAGYEIVYDRTMISKTENGRRDVSLTDAILAASLDPLKRGVEWIAGPAELKPLPNSNKRRAGNS